MGKVARQEGHPGRTKPLLQKPDEMLSNEPALSPRQPLNGQRVLRIPWRNARADKVRDGNNTVKVCTVNVGTLRGRGRELVDMLDRRKVDICFIQEVRYKNEGCNVIGDEEQKYKLWYKGNPEGTNGVGILMKHEMADNVIDVTRHSDRLISIKAVFGDSIWHFFSLYAPQVGRPPIEKEEFWEMVEEEIGRLNPSDGLVIGGDVNAHVGTDIEGYEEVLGLYGFGERNPEGVTVLDICKNQGLRVLNSYFKKGREKKITFKSGGAETEIDLIMMRPKTGVAATDCAAIPGESFLTQHRAVRAKINIKSFIRKEKPLKKRLKTWKLKSDDVRESFEDIFSDRLGNIPRSWKVIQESLMAAAEQACGWTTGRRGRRRQTWWWNDHVQGIIKEKKKAYKKWQRSKSNTDKEIYFSRKREARRCVAEAKTLAWIEWSENLCTNEGRNKMFRVASQMKKDRTDILGTNFIKNADGGLEIDEEAVRKVWKDYFEILLNEENENEFDSEPVVEGPIEDVTLPEVRAALRAMKPRRAAGPSGVTSDLFKYVGETGVKELHQVFQEIFLSGKCPDEWSESLTVAIYKGKGDPLQCGKHRGLRLLEHGMKIFEKVLDRRLRKLVNISDGQFGFRPGKSCTDAIFILRRLQEKYGEKKKKLYHIFVDLEKAFDRVPRRAIEWTLRRQGIPEKLVQLVMSLYENSKTKVCAAGGTSELFNIGVGVHQGSALSPLLFVLIVEEVSKQVRRGGVWEMLYADDLVLTAESKPEVEAMFIQWKDAMELRGLKVNMAKTKLMISGTSASEPVQLGRYPCSVCGKGVGVNSILCTCCEKWCHKRCSGLLNLIISYDFVCPRCVTGSLSGGESPIEVDGEVVEAVESFCYLGDMISCEGGAERAIKTRTAAAWRKWKDLSSLLVNRHIPLKSRSKVYCACIRPVLLYGVEAWAITKKQKETLENCDRRMLRYMAGVSLSDRVTSEEVAGRCGVKSLAVVMRESRLRWYGHVKRRHGEGLLGEAMELEVTGSRPRGRPKITWMKNVEEDLLQLNLNQEDVYDREKWRVLIKRQTH